jgi:MFS family permease
MNGMLRVPRSRGALSGVLLILLGAWGALVPFVGPYFQYAYTPDHAWTYTTGRLWLSILPGAATVLGGLIVLISASRPLAHFGAWLAALSGAWFALGWVIGPTWIGTQMATGTPVGGSSTRALELIGFYVGLGVVIVLVAGMALGRFSVIGVREARRAEPAEPVTPAEHVEPAEPVATGGAARTSALDKSGTADKPGTGDEPATTGTPASRRFGLRHKEPTTGTAEPATEPVSPSNM